MICYVKIFLDSQETTINLTPVHQRIDGMARELSFNGNVEDNRIIIRAYDEEDVELKEIYEKINSSSSRQIRVVVQGYSTIRNCDMNIDKKYNILIPKYQTEFDGRIKYSLVFEVEEVLE